MKKRLLVLLVATVTFSINSFAQFFVGGTLGFGYRNSTFGMRVKPNVGYEFSDRWAVGLGAGFDLVDDEVAGILNPFVRFNCWNNTNLFLDLKASGDVVFNGESSSAFVGLKPSVRYAFNDHWQVAADVAVLGLDIHDGECKPAFVFSASSVELTLHYLF